ncbi:MAG: trehalose-phosphatase [Terracidiphilus sp.]
MTPEAAEKVGRFLSGLARSAHRLLLLDYDGTLAPFRTDRFKAQPWPGVRELLTQIQRQGRTRMVVVSGRPAAEIAPLLGLDPPLETWGLHGMERVYPDGRRELEELPASTVQKLGELREELQRDSFGGLFEDKPNAAVMHWRGAAAEDAAEIERKTLALFEPLAHVDGLRLLKFEAGLELRAGRDKGGAVEAILREASAEAPGAVAAAYLGDDLTDEEAFRTLNAAAGVHLTALVRAEKRETAASVWLRPPGELLKFLEMWLAAEKHLASTGS